MTALEYACSMFDRDKDRGPAPDSAERPRATSSAAVGALLAIVLIAVQAGGGDQEARTRPVQTLFNGSGLGGVTSVLSTPDGRHVYAAGSGDLAIVGFARDDARGRLARIAVYREGAAGFRGIGTVSRLALSADGRTLYAVGADTVTALRRDVDSGALSPEQFLRGGFGVSQLFDLAIDPAGDRLYAAGANTLALFAVDENGRLAHRTTLVDGPDTDGLAGRTAVDLSSDGRHLYIVSDFDQSIAVYRREQDSLERVQIITATESALLGEQSDVLVSHDGRHVYAAVGNGDRIAIFARDPGTGTLTAIESLGESLPGRGLAAPSRMALSSDGSRLYVVSRLNSSVALLSRNRDTGLLTATRFESNASNGVVGIGGSSDLALGPAQSHVYVSGADDASIGLFDAALSFIAVERNSSGAISGLRRPAAVAVAPDGKHVYTAGFEDGSVSIFQRGEDGSLTYSTVFRGDAVSPLQQPISLAMSSDGSFMALADFGAGNVHLLRRDDGNGELETLSTIGSDDGVADLRGVAAVAIAPDDRVAIAVSVLNGSAVILAIDPTTAALSLRATMPTLAEPSSVRFSGDGRNLYTTSSGGNAVLVFQPSETGTFSEIQTLRDSDPTISGLISPTGLATSADGRNVYVASGNGIFQLAGSNAVATFARADTDGTLTPVQVLVDEEAGVRGIRGATAVAVSPDGALVAVAGFSGNSLAIFERLPASGELVFVESYFDGFDAADGLAGASAIAFSPSGSELYVTGFADNALNVFRVESPTPPCPGDCDMLDGPGITELIRCVNLALGSGALESCAACDVDGDGRVAINELVQAVNAALNGCP